MNVMDFRGTTASSLPQLWLQVAAGFTLKICSTTSLLRVNCASSIHLWDQVTFNQTDGDGDGDGDGDVFACVDANRNSGVGLIRFSGVLRRITFGGCPQTNDSS